MIFHTIFLSLTVLRQIYSEKGINSYIMKNFLVEAEDLTVRSSVHIAASFFMF
jgi:hypothetical protein